MKHFFTVLVLVLAALGCDNKSDAPAPGPAGTSGGSGSGRNPQGDPNSGGLGGNTTVDGSSGVNSTTSPAGPDTNSKPTTGR